MILLIAAVCALCLLALGSGFPWWVGLIVFVLCAIGAYAAAIFFFSDRTIKAFGTVKSLLRWEDCSRCTAGTQWWNGEYWGPIPPHARRMAEGGRYIEPAQANVRKCSKCIGGGWWLPKIPRRKEKDGED